MTLFKYFLIILLRSYKVVLAYIVVFIVIGFLSMMSLNPVDSVYEEKKVNFALIDEDESVLSQKLTEYLEARNTRIEISEKEASDKKDLEERVFLGYYDVVIIIPKGYAENPELHKLEMIKNSLLTGYYKIKQDIMGYMFLHSASTNASGDVDHSLLQAALEQNVSVDFRENSSGNISIELWFSRFMNSTSYVAIAIIVFVIGTVMADFNQRKIALRNSCAGKSLQIFQSQLILGQILFGFLLSFLLLIPAVLMAGSQVLQTNLGLYWLNLMVLILAILSFTFMMNNVLNNKHALSAIATIFSLGSSFLCGVFIPLEFLSETTQTMGRFFPSYYFVIANESICLGTSLWLRNMGVQLLFAAAFLMVGYYIAKTKHTQKELGI